MSTVLPFAFVNLNRTRLECKVYKAFHTCFRFSHLNRTRLECKDRLLSRKIVCRLIWIEPDWNVKPLALNLLSLLVFHLNRTRLECKAHEIRWAYRTVNIWIEPDWNVKVGGDIEEQALRIIWIEPDWNVKNYRRFYPILWVLFE